MAFFVLNLVAYLANICDKLPASDIYLSINLYGGNNSGNFAGIMPDERFLMFSVKGVEIG
ncbi:MAG: hypothetical protein P4L27_11880 [Ignavibacteriaceae bacterium]|nr:hypothetical protein [Ignavibacteriaceae bacterium]